MKEFNDIVCGELTRLFCKDKNLNYALQTWNGETSALSDKCRNFMTVYHFEF